MARFMTVLCYYSALLSSHKNEETTLTGGLTLRIHQQNKFSDPLDLLCQMQLVTITVPLVSVVIKYAEN